MNRPLIGISGSHNVADRQMFVRENYMQSVLRAGGIPVLLPEIEDEETAKAILDRLDGLLLAGGGDVLPSRYGEETLPACGEDDPQRDIFELLIIPMAIARNMPIFGICRGIQVLNVAMGGTLIQDIESQQNIPKKTHQQEPPFSQPVHTVCFEKGSVFEHITGATEIKTNSMHHQAIKKPADGLQVDGRAEDGITHAALMEDHVYTTWDMVVEQATIKQIMTTDGGDFSKLKMVPFTVDDEVQGLKANMFDCVWVYEGWAVQNAKVQDYPINYFSFKDMDDVFDFYTPVLAANNDFMKSNPDAVKAFLRAAKKGYEHKRQQDAWKCKQHIVDAHQNFIQNSTEISGKRPDDNTKYRADRYCAKRHAKRRAAAF